MKSGVSKMVLVCNIFYTQSNKRQLRMFISVFFYTFSKRKFQISQNRFFCSQSNILQNFRIKIFTKMYANIFEHRSDLQELIWITHSGNSGFIRFRFVSLFKSFLTFTCVQQIKGYLNFRYQLRRALLDELLLHKTKSKVKQRDNQ